MTLFARQLLWARDIQKKRVRVTTLAGVDQYFKHVDACFAESSDAGMAALDRLRFVPSKRLPSDPFSEAYKQAQRDIYLQIAARSTYDVQACEQSPFDLEAAKTRPFPFATGSSRQVGEQLVAQGAVLMALSLPAGARIVEFGPGWGNLTLAMAQTGYDVTAVEVDQRFCDLLTFRAQQIRQTVNVVQTDMLSFDSKTKFDAAIFFESFHHCEDHAAMLAKLHGLVKPGGKVIFAGEPISIFPFPWGVRLDGQSLWVIRKHGWLELGFDPGYFKEILRRNGWRATFQKSPLSHNARIWIAERLEG